MEPGFFLTYLPLSQTYIQKGMYPEAVAELTKAAELSGNHPAILSELACAHALNGRVAEATGILRKFEAQARRDFFDPYFIAVIYISLGEKDKAFEWMERSYEVRSNWMLWINSEPKLNPIRNDPRFHELASRIIARSPDALQ
jgi:tetratricopeptide (TPR) repeat protein